jgi:hypothetical protein
MPKPQSASVDFSPTIQKEWQNLFYEQFKKDSTATKAIGFFSSGGWSNEGQAMFIDRGSQHFQFLYASPSLGVAEIERLFVSQIPRSELNIAAMESAFPLERIDVVSFDNLTWEVVILNKELGGAEDPVVSKSVYINTPALDKFPKHAQLISALRTAVAKVQKDQP